MNRLNVEYLAKHIREKQVLAQAITMIESQKKDHQIKAEELIQRILNQTGRSIRVGISGVPGVGKSTLINQLGLELIAKGHRVAVLAIDPSSEISGGSILGDKTRMTELAQSEYSFIRPSPNKNYLGGVANRTRESILLCEAAGYDVILVETVGVGQSETMVATMVDCLVVLMLTGAGDDLQGLKKGIIEMGDIFAFTKADGENALKAKISQSELSTLLCSIHSKTNVWVPQVITCSAYEKAGLNEFWNLVLEYKKQNEQCGEWLQKRQKQIIDWIWNLALEKLKSNFLQSPVVKNEISKLQGLAAENKISVWKAADDVLEYYLKSSL